MKKIYLLIMVSVVFLGAFAQNTAERSSIKKHIVGIDNHQQSPTNLSKAVILSEDFETAALPTGWTQIDGDCGWLFGADGSSSYWTVPAHTNYAYANDDLCGSGGDMADVWLITPSIDLTSASGLVLEFASFAGSDIQTIKTSIDGGTTWNDLTTIEQNAAWTTESISLSSVDGEADVKIAFHFNDGGSWGYGWAIDDVLIYELAANDLGVIAATPTVVLSGNSATPTVTVKNFGGLAQNDFDISVIINDGTTDVYTSTLNVTAAALASLTSEVYTMSDEWTTPADGTYTITASVTLTGDENSANNELVFECTIINFDTFAGNATTEQYAGLNLVDGAVLELGTLSIDPFPMSEEWTGMNIYRVNSDFTYGTVNEGVYTPVGTFTGVSGTPTGLAYDFASGVMYVCVLNGDDLPQLCTADLGTGVLTLVGTGTDGAMISIDFANDGFIYGPALDDNLYKIDPTTGAQTLIGALGFDLNYGQDVSYNIEDNRLYTITCGDIYEFGYYDITTGAFNSIADMGGDQYATFVITKNPEGPFAISYTPENNATDVTIDAIVSATFDVNITEVDLTGITITPDPANVVASIVDDVLTIAHDDFAYNTTYTVLIPTGAISDGTDNLGYDVTWSFTTALDPTACNDPSNIIISDITAFEASVTWTENGIGAEWFVNYGPVGFDPETEGTTLTASTTTQALSGLTENTTYEVYVQANCNPETSAWAGPVEFTTLHDCSAPITTLPYTTDFTTEEPCWVIDQTNATETWAWDSGAAEFICQYDENGQLQEELLISPKFDLSTISDNIAVTFTWNASYYWAVDPENGYDMFLKVSTNGTDWVELWNETDEGVFENWTDYITTVTANAYAGEPSVWFAFNYYAPVGDGAAWSIKDFTVDVVSSSKLDNISEISVYPNPANNVINVANAENENIVVLNMLGEVVANISNASSNQAIDISNLSNGTYFVKVNSEVFKINLIK
ncbi:MAG: Ig-like domain-containing protein [Bacteroidales bacterium]|nr:Ig-like domain-containing protein [Bacteroidales bacterium]